MDELEKIDSYIVEGKDEKFILNCLQCVGAKFTEVCICGKVGIVRWMIEHGADVHARDDYALHCASGNGHAEVVKVLLESGADVHARGDLALRCASRNGHVEVVKVLLEFK